MPDKRNHGEDYPSEEKIVDAKCPRCRRKHKAKLYWTGRGMPKIYCEGCRRFVERNPMIVKALETESVGSDPMREVSITVPMFSKIRSGIKNE